jgi:hypothetical protein
MYLIAGLKTIQFKLGVSPKYVALSALMDPTTFLSRALLFLWRLLCFPFRTREDNLGGSPPQLSPQVQMPHPTRQGEGSDELVVGEYSSESAVGNTTECVLITRKFRTTNFLNDR